MLEMIGESLKISNMASENSSSESEDIVGLAHIGDNLNVSTGRFPESFFPLFTL